MISRCSSGDHALLADWGSINMYVFFMCRSLTTAQKAARALQSAGIYSSVAKAPQKENPGGCTYGVKVAHRYGGEAEAILAHAGIAVEKTLELPELAERGVRL